MKPVLTSIPGQLQSRSVVLIGLMGVGKTTVGRRLGKALNLPFVDADAEIERSAGRSIPEIFADYGEAAFRKGEQKVITRLLQGPPQVLATGGGAFLNLETRRMIEQFGVSIWLRADLDELVRRTAKRNTRPLLNQGDPKQILAKLIEERHPVYAKADLVVDSDQGPHTNTVDAILLALQAFQERES
jgi:shikimate kinase